MQAQADSAQKLLNFCRRHLTVQSHIDGVGEYFGAFFGDQVDIVGRNEK